MSLDEHYLGGNCPDKKRRMRNLKGSGRKRSHPYSRRYPSKKPLATVACIPADIRTRHLHNTSQRRYLLSELAWLCSDHVLWENVISRSPDWTDRNQQLAKRPEGWEQRFIVGMKYEGGWRLVALRDRQRCKITILQALHFKFNCLETDNMYERCALFGNLVHMFYIFQAFPLK
jgi:hypothetical protein